LGQTATFRKPTENGMRIVEAENGGRLMKIKTGILYLR
jgi:hypothetical protein